MDIRLYSVKILNMFSMHSKSGKESNIQIKKYIDFSPDIQVFYHNYFFDEYKFVLKIVLTPSLNENDHFYDNATNNGNCLDLRLEKFDLTKYVYLLYYE